jgi:hypothetical protein
MDRADKRASEPFPQEGGDMARQVGFKKLVQSLSLCLNKHGWSKARLPVLREMRGYRLAPRPSPALVRQPTLGRVAFLGFVWPYGDACIFVTPPMTSSKVTFRSLGP